MDIFDYDNGKYDRDILTEALRYYQKYNDWEILESEFKNKIDESRSWSKEEIHDCIEHIQYILRKMQEDSKGIFLKGDEWFSPQINELRFWNYYKKTMKHEKWSAERIKTLQKQCTDIINFLPNPKRKCHDGNYRAFQRKGLVYGDVQAGKTASIAGVVSMYASSGCPLIIVLSGVTNNLRWQTQQRLIKDLKIGIEPHWHLLTPEKDRIGKGQPYVESLLAGSDVSIGVFKKNPYALRSLIKYCEKVSDENIWKNNQVLIIDDECDQYSPNVKCIDEDDNTEYPHSTINGLIVKLLKLFPRVCYIGYTATPFANVLNELPGEESLYPEDFIYAIEKSDLYFGGDKIFGSDVEEEPETLDMINYVTDDETMLLRKGTPSSLPQSLEDAINYFVVATSCKYKRNLTSHSSMLIHVDLKTDVHAKIETLVNNYVEKLRTDFFNNNEKFDAKLKRLWDKEKDRNTFSKICELFPNSKKENYYIPKYSDLREQIRNVLSRLEVVVDNSTRPAEKRLNYDTDSPGVYIVIGGNTLSRGLTLEGLVTSYFARPSKNYDTLLQMGRWFGYRRGYEDLPRIWMPPSLVNDFWFLESVENEIREEIEDYSFELSPKEFALRIRTHPRMKITRALAMQSAQASGSNYGGTKAETLFLEKDDMNIINHNINATKKFLDNLPGNPELYHNAYFYRNCDASYILNFIADYKFSDRNKDCKAEPLTAYVKKALEKNILHKWNVIVKSNVDGIPFKISDKITCNLLSRARVDEKISKSEVYIKLHEPRDFKIDTDDKTWYDHATAKLALQFKVRQEFYQSKDEEVPGLLVIYPVNKDSKPKNPESNRFLPLEAAQHLIGLMFVFPIIKDKDLYEYMQIPLETSFEDDGEI